MSAAQTQTCAQAEGELRRLNALDLVVTDSCVFHFGTGAYKEYATFGQLPVLRDGTLLLVESGAISRHLARRACIDGRNLEEKARVDMYYELSKDIASKKSAVYDLAGHPDAKNLKHFLTCAEKACDGRHFVGDYLTLADIAMFHSLHFMTEVAPGSLDGYPNLSSFVKNFASQPAISEYLASDRRVPLTQNELAKGPHAGIAGYRFTSPLKPGTYARPWNGGA